MGTFLIESTLSCLPLMLDKSAILLLLLLLLLLLPPWFVMQKAVGARMPGRVAVGARDAGEAQGPEERWPRLLPAGAQPRRGRGSWAHPPGGARGPGTKTELVLLWGPSHCSTPSRRLRKTEVLAVASKARLALPGSNRPVTCAGPGSPAVGSPHCCIEGTVECLSRLSVMHVPAQRRSAASQLGAATTL